MSTWCWNDARRLVRRLLPPALLALATRAAGTAGADFLNIPVGGRPAALGGAYSALAEDAYAPIWNPAGLSRLPGKQLGGMHLEYAESIGYEFVSYAHPLRDAGLGASVQYFHPDAATSRDASGNVIGTYGAHYGAYSLAYGRGFGALSLGAAGKLIDASIAGTSAKAYAADLGGSYAFGPRLSVAAVAANLGSKLKFVEQADPLPQSYRLGLRVVPVKKWRLAAETGYIREREAMARFGAEWQAAPAAALRAGYRTDGGRGAPGLTGLTMGAGLSLYGQSFDYAWAPMGDLGQTQYFSVLFTFGKRSERR